MLGAIAGDIIGSVLRVGLIRRLRFPYLLMHPRLLTIPCSPSPRRRHCYADGRMRKPIESLGAGIPMQAMAGHSFNGFFPTQPGLMEAWGTVSPCLSAPSP